MPITARPAAARRWATWNPMNPAAPVTRIGSAAIDLTLHARLRPSYAVPPRSPRPPWRGLGRSRHERQACCVHHDRCYRSAGMRRGGIAGGRQAPRFGNLETTWIRVRRPSRMDARTRPAPRLIYVVTEDWYFLSHRLPMARAARAAGYEVHVATNVGDDADAIRREGFTLHPVRFAARTDVAIPSVSAPSWRLRKVYRAVTPAIVHHVAMQPSVLGIVAAFGRGASPMSMPSPASAMPSSIRPARRASLRGVIRLLLRFGLNRRRAVGLVQNPDDRDMLAELGVKPDHVVIIPGSGIDADRFRPIPEPDGPVTFAYRRPDAGRQGRAQPHRRASGSCVPPTSNAGCCSPALPIPPIPAAFRKSSWRTGGANPASPGSERSPTSPPCGSAPMSRCCRRAAKDCRRACSRRPHADGP
jgi:hypothetical protein